MAHYSSNKKLNRDTPPEWLKVGANIGKLANKWAERFDLVAYVGMGAGVDKGAPAIFDPASAEIEVNIPIAFGFATAEAVGDMNERAQQFEFPKASGAILHEAMHARYTTWDLRKAATELPPKVLESLHLLEESRIEALGVKAYPKNKSFLRACAMEIVIGDVKDGSLDEMESTRQAAHTAGLTFARVDAGVLEHSDIEPLAEVIKRVLPDEMIRELRAVWREFQTLNARYHEERMYELAYEWERIISDRIEETGEKKEEEQQKQMLSDIADALAEAMGKAEIGAMIDGERQQTQERFEASASVTQSQAEEKRDNQKEAGKVFANSTPTSVGSNSELVRKRKPTAEERVSAVKIAQALEKAKYRDRIRIESASATPPGRLKTRTLVQGEAYREQGVMIETTPFQRVQRKHTEDPNLTIGVMVDISGSMRSAMEPMASAAWILSEATRRVQGKVAMVYFGNGVFPTLKVGQHLTDVNVYSAMDSTEEFDSAFKALDGSLNLLNGSGARLLVVVSDGEYRSDQKDKARHWVDRCAKAGVAVLWLGAGTYGFQAERYCNGREAIYTSLGSHATDAADAIGKASVKVLAHAGEVRKA